MTISTLPTPGTPEHVAELARRQRHAESMAQLRFAMAEQSTFPHSKRLAHEAWDWFHEAYLLAEVVAEIEATS